MTIHTAEQLSDRLASQLYWRKKELTTILAMVEANSKPGDKQNALLRSGITLLYAHWEGFIKVAASAYLEFVAMQRLPYKDLTGNFIALSMKSKLEDARQTNKASLFNSVAEFFLTGLSEKCKIPYRDAVETRSNLSATIFREIIAMLNLDYSFYESKERFIDNKLLKQRNFIAHGQELLISPEDYRQIHNEIVSLLEIFRNQIENAAIMNAYRRPVAFE